MSARDGLGLLPFSDYADDDPNRLPLDEPEPPRIADVDANVCAPTGGKCSHGYIFAHFSTTPDPRPPHRHLYRSDWYDGTRCWSCQEIRP